MKLVITSTNIQIGESTYALNSIFFKAEGSMINIYPLGTDGQIVSGRYDQFTDLNNVPFTSTAAVVAALKTSFVTP